MGKLPFDSQLITLTKLAKLANVKYFDLYNRKVGVYKTPLSANIRTRIANAIVKDIKPFFADLGYDIAIRPKDS